MLDFLLVSTRSIKKDTIEVYPKFVIKKSNDLMIRGGDFYAIWDAEKGLWSMDEQDAQRLIDEQVKAYYEANKGSFGDSRVKCSYMWDADSGIIDKWHKYCQKQMRDNFHMLDEKLIFQNEKAGKRDYASKILPYPLEEIPTPAYDELISVLYSPEERAKIEWAIGSIVTGESKKLQKFIVLYGESGTGKSTVLNIIQQLFDGYYSVFDARALGSSNNSFALESFKSNPLVAIQHDGDLSKIEDNTRLNSLVSHELMSVNEKFKSTYSNKFKSFLFMGTNKPVKITDAKSGLIRRLIDVSPSGDKVDLKVYKKLVKQIEFELGGIAWKCKEAYLNDPDKYDDYIPINMLGASNDFYNFIDENYLHFKKEDQVTLKAAWEMYKVYCEEANVLYAMPQRSFKEELKNYFKEFAERATLNGERIRNLYSGFRTEKFEKSKKKVKKETIDETPVDVNWLHFAKQASYFDEIASEYKAQLANDKGTPISKWSEVTTTLKDISTKQLHYVKVPTEHIVIDFDIVDENGEKSFEKNLEAASMWPATYAELSKSGNGIHLHYIFKGDVDTLSRVYSDHIEVKVFKGNSSLRRKLTQCNDIPIATISSGLPTKEIKPMINNENVKNEKHLRTLIKNNLEKKYHAATKPSMDFIFKLLDDAYKSGMTYDVSNMRASIFAFAAGSTNNSEYCIKLVSKMKFKSDDIVEDQLDEPVISETKSDNLVFYDVEVFPNLFLVNWKFQGAKSCVRMINPKPNEIEQLLSYKLIGFNNRRYDNHILYARLMGYSNEELFGLSQRLVNGDKDATFREAYGISYTDVYDFSSEKQSLKKWEIELGIHHQELGLPWDQPVDEELWPKVAEYCDNDVIATEKLFEHLSADWHAREMLAYIANMSVNSSTNTLTTKIIFGNDRNPELVYPDISEEFPGYSFDLDPEDKKYHNMYRGIDLGRGGYVYAEPGMHENVCLLDIRSLHPYSIINLNLFGKYTKNFEDLVDARGYVKHGEIDKVKKMFNGKLVKFLDGSYDLGDLAYALKIAINSVYGLTSASFDNPFRDKRNQNNIVALRGALFMKTLQDEVTKRGFTVAHIKTDSIKIPNASKEIIDFCMDFAKKYGYEFEHEATYSKMCLVNDAVYIAKDSSDGHWTATGTEFQVPYVFKTLFSKEQIVFEDMCTTAEVKVGKGLYLQAEESDSMRFIGKVGSFCPMQEGHGGKLFREKDGKFNAVQGTKGYLWQEAEIVKDLKLEKYIDESYFKKMVDDAVDHISDFGDFEAFID